jgi:two-component system, cell cycle response regulator DivK
MTTFHTVKALIIEDDAVSVNVLRRLLDQVLVESLVIRDYEVYDYLSGVTGSSIVFLDLEMPNVTGYEVLKLIRQLPAFDGVPVIAYTTHISHMNDVRLAGFDGFLGKPLDSASFPDQLARILQGEQVWEVSS